MSQTLCFGPRQGSGRGSSFSTIKYTHSIHICHLHKMSIPRTQSEPQFSRSSSSTIPRSYSQAAHLDTHLSTRFSRPNTHPGHLSPTRSPCADKEDPFGLRSSGFFPSYPFADEEREEEWNWLHPVEEDDEDSVTDLCSSSDEGESSDAQSLFNLNRDELASRAIKGEDKFGVLNLSMDRFLSLLYSPDHYLFRYCILRQRRQR